MAPASSALHWGGATISIETKEKKGPPAMTRGQRVIAWSAGIAAIILAVGLYLVRHQPLTELTGVVLRQDPNPGKQLPVVGAELTLDDGFAQGPARTDSNGLFHLKLRRGTRTGETATLRVRHPDYLPMSVPEFLQDRIYVLRMVPGPTQPQPPAAPPQKVSDVRIRYSVKMQTTEDVGSAIKTFEVVNQGDVPCDDNPPCSPDGKWKAAIGGTTLEAGDSGEFHDARITCIAGPCPFTAVENDSFTKGGREIRVSVRNWSDTVTFVLEAEVTRTLTSDLVRQSFPVLFNQVFSFTLPASAQSLSIEATVNGADVVYPIGPALKLSWATCTVSLGKNQIRLYRCELKPEYQF